MKYLALIALSLMASYANAKDNQREMIDEILNRCSKNSVETNSSDGFFNDIYIRDDKCLSEQLEAFMIREFQRGIYKGTPLGTKIDECIRGGVDSLGDDYRMQEMCMRHKITAFRDLTTIGNEGATQSEMFGSGFNDGFMNGYKTTCAIPVEPLETHWNDGDYSRGFLLGQAEGALACVRE